MTLHVETPEGACSCPRGANEREWMRQVWVPCDCSQCQPPALWRRLLGIIRKWLECWR